MGESPPEGTAPDGEMDQMEPQFTGPASVDYTEDFDPIYLNDLAYSEYHQQVNQSAQTQGDDVIYSECSNSERQIDHKDADDEDNGGKAEAGKTNIDGNEFERSIEAYEEAPNYKAIPTNQEEALQRAAYRKAVLNTQARINQARGRGPSTAIAKSSLPLLGESATSVSAPAQISLENLPVCQSSPNRPNHRRNRGQLHPLGHPLPPPPVMPGVPQPGPAKLGPNSELSEWLEEAKQCHHLPENIMKKLCERVKECLMEESNIQPVRTPVTICGDIHGQFYDLLELFRVAGGMPGETNPEKPITRTTTISSDDLEPPTEITDPALRRKIRNSDSGVESGASGDDNDDEEPRGRARTAGQTSRGDSSGGDSAIGQESSGSGNQSFIFLGDFVDRGYFSLETFTLLMCLKASYPDKITLVRGNHESRQITQVYGFYEECQQKYGNASVWKSCCQVFDFLVLAAIVDGEILCVHGGLSPEIRTVDQIRVVARAQEIPHEGAFCDLVWSDPEDIDTWAISPRGAGWLFGDKVATEFNHVNGLKLIARAHQLVNEGYKYHFTQKSVVTVWSAPNYCYRCGNVASIMNVGEDLDPKFSIFSAVPEDQRQVPAGRRGAGDYFL